MSPDQSITLFNGVLSAIIARLGAELVGLRESSNRELLWQGDPRFWASQSPILFPIVGRVPGDRMTFKGHAYPMPLHGFAQSCHFEVVHQDQASCTLSLHSTNPTREHFPFEFRLAITYSLTGSVLKMAVVVENLDDEPMPFNLGFHPGFRWPLEANLSKLDHFIEFPEDDLLETYRAVDAFRGPRIKDIELKNHRLLLDEALFHDGALMFPSLHSRRVSFGSEVARTALDVEFHGLPRLALWMRPSADFLCIEPWLNMPSTASPGDESSASLAPGEAHEASMSIDVQVRQT